MTTRTPSHRSLTARFEAIFRAQCHATRSAPASKSYGIEVARLAGLPGSVLRRAREVLRRLETEGAPRPGMVRPDDGQLPLRLEDGAGPAYLADDVTADPPSQESEVLAALRGAQLDETTPLEALQLLSTLQKELKGA